MGRKKLTMEEKARALALIEQGMPVKHVAAELNVSRVSLFKLKKSAASLPTGTLPPRKLGCGRKRKTSERTDKMLVREVKQNPSITAAELKKKHPDLLQDVAVRTLQHRLQKDLGLPCRCAAKKPLLTDTMRKKRLQFAKQYRDWTPEQWKSVMWSDESTFRLVRGGSSLVRRPSTVSRYDAHYTVKTVKHPDSVMVWACFSGKRGRGGLYFLPKNVTMKGANYIDVLKEHLLPAYEIQGTEFFMHDGAPAHKSRAVKQFLDEQNIKVLDWPGNSPDLNPIENAWNKMKNDLAKSRPTSIVPLKEALKKMWVTMDVSYLEDLAISMPKRIEQVLKTRGNMTKY